MWHLAFEVVVVVATTVALNFVFMIVRMVFVVFLIVGNERIVIVGCSVTRGTVVILGGAVDVKVSLEVIVSISIGVIVVQIYIVAGTVVVCCGPTER
jgi:hypothetical protein